MILLDTNVLSELARAAPETAVLAWATTVLVSRLWHHRHHRIRAALRRRILPIGKRRAALERAIDAVLRRFVQDRVLPFDRAAAQCYAALAADRRLTAERRRLDRPVHTADLQIQATARVHAVQAIATRNTADFTACGVPLIDPWQTA